MNHEHWTEKKTVASKLRIELKTALAQRNAMVEALEAESFCLSVDIGHWAAQTISTERTAALTELRSRKKRIDAALASVKESQ